jgi:hypothetical protein
MKPVIDLSLSAFHRSMVGTPRGAFFVVGAEGLGATLFLEGADGFGAVKNDPKPWLASGVLFDVALTGSDGDFLTDVLARDFFCGALSFPSSSPSPNRDDNEMVAPGTAAFSSFSASRCLAFFEAGGGGLAGFGI